MKRKRGLPAARWCCALLLALGGGGSWAAEVALSADEMSRRLAVLMREAPEIAGAQAELAGRSAELDSATYARWPRADLSVTGGDTATALRGNPVPKVDSRVTAALRYTLIDFGHRSARQRAAEHALQSGLAAVEKSQEVVAKDALTVYLQVLRFALLVDVGRNSQAALAELERLEARRVELGGAGITDAKLASSRLAVSANKLAQFELSLQESLSKFAALYGFVPTPERLPVVQVPGRWMQADAESALAAAVERSPAVRASGYAVEQAKADLEAEKAARFPAVDLSVSKRYEYPGGFTEKPQLGVQMSVGSNSTLEASAKVARAVSRVQTEEQRHATLLRDLRQLARAAWQRQALGGTRVGMLSRAATDSLTVLNARMRLNSLGRETTLALLDAQVEANNILIDWVNAIFDQRLGELDLAKETGALVPGQDAELDWAKQLFVAKDYRAPVRQTLSSASRRQAVGAGAPASGVTAASPAARPDFARVAALRVQSQVPSRTGPQSRGREYLVSFALDLKPFDPQRGKGW